MGKAAHPALVDFFALSSASGGGHMVGDYNSIRLEFLPCNPS
jgi:hypothetical protein